MLQFADDPVPISHIGVAIAIDEHCPALVGAIVPQLVSDGAVQHGFVAGRIDRVLVVEMLYRDAATRNLEATLHGFGAEFADVVFVAPFDAISLVGAVMPSKYQIKGIKSSSWRN